MGNCLPACLFEKKSLPQEAFFQRFTVGDPNRESDGIRRQVGLTGMDVFEKENGQGVDDYSRLAKLDDRLPRAPGGGLALRKANTLAFPPCDSLHQPEEEECLGYPDGFDGP